MKLIMIDDTTQQIVTKNRSMPVGCQCEQCIKPVVLCTCDNCQHGSRYEGSAMIYCARIMYVEETTHGCTKWESVK